MHLLSVIIIHLHYFYVCFEVQAELGGKNNDNKKCICFVCAFIAVYCGYFESHKHMHQRTGLVRFALCAVLPLVLQFNSRYLQSASGQKQNSEQNHNEKIEEKNARAHQHPTHKHLPYVFVCEKNHMSDWMAKQCQYVCLGANEGAPE